MAEQVALITGGASGMGRLMAGRLASEGWTVAIVDRNAEALAAVAATSNRLQPFPCDVTDAAAVESMIDQVERTLGPVVRLAHAAAIMPGAPVDAMDADSIRRVMDINYGGTVNVVKAVLPRMKQRDQGQILIFGSIAGVAFSQNMAAYCASKAAVNAFAEVLIHENAGNNLQIILVCPPAVATPLIDQALATGPASLRNSAKQGKLATPEAMIDAIEGALRSRQSIIYPGQAKMIWRMRRWAPNFTWRMTTKMNAG